MGRRVFRCPQTWTAAAADAIGKPTDGASSSCRHSRRCRAAHPSGCRHCLRAGPPCLATCCPCSTKRHNRAGPAPPQGAEAPSCRRLLAGTLAAFARCRQAAQVKLWYIAGRIRPVCTVAWSLGELRPDARRRPSALASTATRREQQEHCNRILACIQPHRSNVQAAANPLPVSVRRRDT